jgi:hypothetical protein
VWYALGVGKGWVEIRESPTPPKSELTEVRIGDRLFPIRTFKGGTSRGVVRGELLRKVIGSSVITGVKRISAANAEQLIGK